MAGQMWLEGERETLGFTSPDTPLTALEVS